MVFHSLVTTTLHHPFKKQKPKKPAKNLTQQAKILKGVGMSPLAYLFSVFLHQARERREIYLFSCDGTEKSSVLLQY